MKTTTFIVGAGASREFGLFKDKGLSACVMDTMHVPDDGGAWFRTDPIGSLIRGLPTAPQLLVAARGLRDGLTSSPSIDDYLHNHRNDPAMILMGKLAIARCIVEAEAGCAMRTAGRTGLVWSEGEDDNFEPQPPAADDLDPGVVMRALSGTWLGKLFTQLTPGVSKEQVSTIFDRVRFICFNYDRCIETFLFYALQSHYRITAKNAGEIVSRVQIVHPYGTIGGLSFVPGVADPVIFGQALDHVNLSAMANNIRTYNEQVGGCCDQETITQYLAQAERVVFLGFGFHKQNMAMLQRPRTVLQAAIYATCYDEPQSRRNAFSGRIADAGMPSPSMAFAECAPFIHEYALELID